MDDPRSDPNSFTLSWPVPEGMVMATDRLAYWRQAGAIAAPLKDDELRKGLDKDGRAMIPISSYTRAHRKSAMGVASPSAPPLTPAYGLSRTRSLLLHKAYLDRVVFYWGFDTHIGESWGVILGYHRDGEPGRLPKRDVIGLSRAARGKARRDADQWWATGHPPAPAEPPKGHQRIFVPRPAPTVPSPLAQAPLAKRPIPQTFRSDWQVLINGRFQSVNTEGLHVEAAGSTRGIR